VGEHDLGDPLAGDPAGLGVHAVQDGGDEVLDRKLALAEPDRAVVDAALGVGLEAGRGADGRADRVGADEQAGVGAGEDGGGQQRGAVEQQRPDRPLGSRQRSHRVRRAEINA
jgi:hypothetical protein